MLTVQLFVQVFYIVDTEGNTTVIFPSGFLISFVKNFNPIMCNIFFKFWQFIWSLNLNGLCVQFIYRYFVLNRNIKINFRRYLFMFSMAFFVTLFYILDITFFVSPYSNGGVKYFDNLDKTWPFTQFKMGTTSVLSLLPIVLVEIIPYLIIFVCGFKMVRYVKLNSNLDGDLKKLNKLLTKVLIILAVVPFINYTGALFYLSYSTTNNYTTNIIRILIAIFLHFLPVFNPFICILTNTPYRNAIFNRSQINPQ
uniref:Uncharacterized protein n=1 Tax=Meloidogyne enterolobii TaxID=390850 RepID=A0A6V7V5D0_MELEN|nr:unnamed protein product [Meloidogyne enterolobii]